MTATKLYAATMFVIVIVNTAFAVKNMMEGDKGWAAVFAVGAIGWASIAVCKL